MAFLLRSISRSADGREIVRTSKVSDDLLKVGRDPECDIRLNDLAVALHHATIEQVSATRVGVSAEMGMSLELDGSNTQFGQIDLAIGGTVKIGPFLLRIMPPELGGEDVPIVIQRADAGAVTDKFDTRRFALQSVMPGKRLMAWTLTLIVLAIFLVWPIMSFYQNRDQADRTAGGFHADSLWSSGALSQSHAALGSNCQACHVRPFEPVRDAACAACHVNIHDHADLARMQRATPQLGGFRRLQQSVGNLFGQTPGRCVECHTEHEGPQAMVPTPQQFCADCHTDLRGRLPDTRLGSASDFGTAHPEFQPVVLIQWNGDVPQFARVPLNQRPREESNLKFPHALHLGSLGGAANAARANGIGARLQCASCHTPTADGARFERVDMERNCGSCHSLSFDEIGGTIRRLRHGSPEQVIADIRGLYRAGGPAFPPELNPGARGRPGDANQIRAAVQFARARAGTAERGERAIRAIFSAPRGTCFECHTIVAPPPGTLNYRIRPIQFTRLANGAEIGRYVDHGWFDHRAHQIVQRPGQRREEGSAACLSCHTGAQTSQASNDLLLPDLQSCRACHRGEHPDSTQFVPSTCAMCHDYHMDQGVPAGLLRQRARGERREPSVARPPPSASRGQR
ncbi:MAG TPA: cytochrome c3 family protein [Allosphingosinicella sp.]|jgi:predicted CXXCH cytochrome family protein|nr:cytochrome c3 family protein [Allosphingosinicella sp.]